MSKACIILNEPENPDNIGATARAMKNMGFKDLRLVKPPADWREKASKMAVWADDLLSSAKVYDSLKEAISDMSLVIGTTRREGGRRRAFIDFDKALQKAGGVSGRKKAAFLFGKESKGLSNEDLSMCDFYTTLPADSGYPSINLAQSVMIVCFSIHALLEGLNREIRQANLQYVNKEEFESVMKAFSGAVEKLEYKPEIAKRIDFTFRGLLKRGGMLKSEGQMIKGLSRRICDRAVPIIRKTTRKKPASASGQ